MFNPPPLQGGNDWVRKVWAVKSLLPDALILPILVQIFTTTLFTLCRAVSHPLAFFLFLIFFLPFYIVFALSLSPLSLYFTPPSSFSTHSPTLLSLSHFPFLHYSTRLPLCVLSTRGGVKKTLHPLILIIAC